MQRHWRVRTLHLALSLLLLTGPATVLAEAISFAFYNVQNFAVVESSARDASQPLKAAESVNAVIRIIHTHSPDILLVCEMGSEEDFAEFRRMLADAGMQYPHHEFVSGADTMRHLCLVSRFPITARQSQTDLTFEINGRREHLQRGILDVILALPGGSELHVLGAHLKSRRPVPQGEALLRRHEAMLLRRHIDAILQKKPDTRLLVAGDLNDTKDQPPVLEIQGVRGRPGYLTDLAPKDAEGDRWTHHWATNDNYSRVDYLMVSNALRKSLGVARVDRSPDWSTASDHRLLFVTIAP